MSKLESYTQLSFNKKERQDLKMYLSCTLFKKLLEDMHHQNRARREINNNNNNK